MGIKNPGLADQDLGEVGIDPPVANLIGMSQGIAGDPAAKAHVIEKLLIAAKAGFDIAQTFAVGELGKGQAEELVPAGKRNEFVVALVPLDAFLKLVSGKEFHQLRENCFSHIHMPAPLKKVRKYGIYGILNSNRKMTFSQDSEIVS